MTTEIEKKFFKAFGIPKNVKKYRQYNFGQVPYGQQELKKSLDNGIECQYIKAEPSEGNDCVYWTEIYYPEITDRILLELICILTKVHPEMDCCCFLSTCENVEQLKELALEDCLEYSEHIYIAVRKLFGVEE